MSKVRFLFETSFDSPEPGPVGGGEAAALRYGEEELDAAREEAWREGREAGLAEARREVAAGVAGALEAIGASLGEIETRYAESGRDACRLALVIARKLAPASLAREPLVETEALIGACLDELREEPRIVIRVAEAQIDELRAHVDALAARHAFEGQLVLLGDDEISGADCRIEWADGGARRSLAANEAAIERLIARHFADASQGTTTNGEQPVGGHDG